MKSKLLYIYGSRGDIRNLTKLASGLIPDTAFFGYNHIDKEKFETSTIEIEDMFSLRLSKLIRSLFGFNQTFLFYIGYIFRNDFVFSPVAFNLLFLKSFFGFRKPKWIIFNINLTNILSRAKYKKKLLLFVIKRAFKIICISRSQVSFLKNLGVPEKVLVYVPFGVDKNYYKPVYTNDGYILSAGRDNGRDYKTLVEAVRGLPIKLKIVCSKRNISETLSIPSNVEIIYDTDISTLRSLYERSLMVIVASHSENYFEGSDCSGQTVILDAMACGKAVIASYRTWMDGYLSDGINSFLVKPEDHITLRKKIIELCEDGDALFRVGKKARESIELSFNTKKMGKEISKLIEKD